MNARRRLALTLGSCALLVGACGSEPTTQAPGSQAGDGSSWRVHTRLVAPASRVGARSEPPDLRTRRGLEHAWEAADPDRPTATLRDDTRPVLAVPMRSRPIYVADMPLAPDRRVPAPPGMMLSLSVEHDWVLAPMVRNSWQKKGASLHLPGVLVPRRTGAPGSLRGLSIPVPAALDTGHIDFFVRAWTVPRDGFTRYETASLSIPDQARLELALGVLEPARETGPVEFSVSACDGESCQALFSERIEAHVSAEQGWQERRLELGEHAGTNRSLRFEARWDADAPDAFSMPVFADPRIIVPAAKMPTPPSIILLSVDTLRADHLPTYGYARETAPFLRDGMAAQGTVFGDFVSAATTTGPSHMSMLTSLSPAVHGATGSHAALATPVSTLAMQLRDVGYETAAFTDDGAIDHERGFVLGFDRFYENKSARVMQEGQIERTFELARAQLDAFAGRPAFLFLHTFQVHAPYTPPPAYGDLFSNEELPPGTSAEEAEAFERAMLYDREIRYMDDELREFVEWLEGRGFFENGVLVFTSDHGEAFREHGYNGHGGLPHDELLRIPLVLRGAGIAAGRRVSERMTHIDLMPTLLEWAGVDAPAHITGLSFADMLRPGDPGSAAGSERVMVSEAWVAASGTKPPSLAIRKGRRKLMRIERSGGEVTYQYFDLERDPGEVADLYSELGDEAAIRSLRELADDYVATAEALRARINESSAALGSPEGEFEAAPLDPEREAKLRALGYIE